MLAGAVRTRWSAGFGIAGSIALHAILYAWLRWIGSVPAIDIEIVLPQTVEFGLTDQPVLGAPPAIPPPAPTAVAAPQPAPEPPAAVEPAPEPEPADKPAPRHDAGALEEKVDKDAGTLHPPPDAAASDDETTASTELTAPDAGAPAAKQAPLLAAYAPPGAQIALRLHMRNVRDSPLADDVRQFLGAVPDWQLLLDGSGIDPLRDLERVYLATPNLQRSSLVVAGQYAGAASLPRDAVKNLARARGKSARWRMRDGIAVAPWHDLDETDRVVALIAPQQFAITRPEDLPRVLSVAHALAARAEKESGQASADPMQALLGLGTDEAFSLSVEGARNFVQGNMRGIPERFEAVVRAPNVETGSIVVDMTGVFETPEAAAVAARYWETVRRRYASHPLVAIVGMSSPLKRATLEAADDRVTLHTEVTVHQARVVLGFLRDALSPPGTGAPAPRSPAPTLRPTPGTKAPPRPAPSPKTSGVRGKPHDATIPRRRADR